MLIVELPGAALQSSPDGWDDTQHFAGSLTTPRLHTVTNEQLPLTKMAAAKATLRSVVLTLLAISLFALLYWLLVHVDIEEWELLAVATAAVRICVIGANAHSSVVVAPRAADCQYQGGVCS
jgi:hypothetical protein